MSVPIIGQPTLTDWNLTIAVACVCGKTILWMGKPAWPGGPGAIVGCSCGRKYTVTRMPVRDTVTGDLEVPLAMQEVVPT